MFAPSPPSLFHRAAHPFPKKYACWLFSASCQQTCGAICVAICSFRNLVIWRWRRGSSLSLLCVCVCVFSRNTGATIPFELTRADSFVCGLDPSANQLTSSSLLKHMPFLLQARQKEAQKANWRHDEERIREYRDSRWERAPDATGEHCWASHHLRWERFSA